MQDGSTRRAVKRGFRALFALEVRGRRVVHRVLRRDRYLLGGSCRGAAKCCEEPSLQVGRIVWYLPTVRRLFLWWQRVVNGFELVRAERRARAFVFRCTHFDREQRRCDSYDSRPGVCRDYPRFLLERPWPDLFTECGHKAVAKDGQALLEVLERQPMSEEQRIALKRRLFLE